MLKEMLSTELTELTVQINCEAEQLAEELAAGSGGFICGGAGSCTSPK